MQECSFTIGGGGSLWYYVYCTNPSNINDYTGTWNAVYGKFINCNFSLQVKIKNVSGNFDSDGVFVIHPACDYITKIRNVCTSTQTKPYASCSTCGWNPISVGPCNAAAWDLQQMDDSQISQQSCLQGC